jgi:hypothetical protein
MALAKQLATYKANGFLALGIAIGCSLGEDMAAASAK